MCAKPEQSKCMSATSTAHNTTTTGYWGKIKIPNVHFAVDCGVPVNPERIKSQFEGGAAFGASLKKFENEAFFPVLGIRPSGGQTSCVTS